MTTVLCTLYNSLYLDKGLVLYDSLCKCAKDFKLYVLCMDEKCYDILVGMNQQHHIPIRLSDFEYGDDELLKAKENRPIGEYCWTCSSSLIRFVISHYNEPVCTYIDADMYFYHDPQVLVDEMIQAGKSVMVTPHRFPKEDEKQADTVGTYCVEFNTFLNNNDSLEVLDYWRNRCLECCSNIGDGIHWGDQKYLEELVDKYDCVHVCQNRGAGVALWNIKLYATGDSNEGMMIKDKERDCNIPLIFYHYQNVTYITPHIVSTSIEKGRLDVDYALVYELYDAYLKRIAEKKEYLRANHQIDDYITVHPTAKGPAESIIKKVIKRTLLYKLLWRQYIFQKYMYYLIDLKKS